MRYTIPKLSCFHLQGNVLQCVDGTNAKIDQTCTAGGTPNLTDCTDGTAAGDPSGAGGCKTGTSAVSGKGYGCSAGNMASDKTYKFPCITGQAASCGNGTLGPAPTAKISCNSGIIP